MKTSPAQIHKVIVRSCKHSRQAMRKDEGNEKEMKKERKQKSKKERKKKTKKEIRKKEKKKERKKKTRKLRVKRLERKG